MKQTLLLMAAGAIAFGAYAEIPAGYYTGIDGKQGEELITALSELAKNHTVITYNTKTWGAFEKTDVREIDGKQAWWDMYSNNLVWLPAHDALNIEHSVANSWWGGKSVKEPYADLFHLNPSDQKANNAKSNYPPGIVAQATILDNGLLKVGTPAEGQGGGAANVFEPADEYKGDFARAFFYVFTAYPEISWKDSYAYVYDADTFRLLPWAADLLMGWHRNDPVDSKEMDRHEEIYKLQNNRNPFIDYPELAEYLWGKDADSAVNAADLTASEAVNRPATPTFHGCWLTGVDTYSLRWWEGLTLPVECTEGELLLSIDGETYYTASELPEIAAAASATEKHVYKAKAYQQVGEYSLYSPVATLNLAALDPEANDYSMARWVRVTAGEEVATGYYLLLSSNTLHVMSTQGGTSSMQYMPEAGFVKFDSEDCVTELPAEAALVSFESVGDNKQRIMVNDTHGNYLGSWNCTEKNKMNLDETAYTPGSAAVNDNDEFVFTFDDPNSKGFGKLQFNKTQPRFLNYSSSQTPVYLYKYAGTGTGIELPVQNETPWAVGIDGNNIIAPAGSTIFDLNGRPVSGTALQPGIYIVVSANKTRKVRI